MVTATGSMAAATVARCQSSIAFGATYRSSSRHPSNHNAATYQVHSRLPSLPTSLKQRHVLWSNTSSLQHHATGRKGLFLRASVTEKTEKQVTAKEVEEWNKKGRFERLEHLEEQALGTLRHALNDFERPTFPCALIAGDVVILDLLARLGAFNKDLVKVVFIDTFHLFEETHTFLRQLENKYGFKAETFQAAGFDSREDYVKVHGPDLYLTDIDEYDRICKVEPFGRALKTLKVDAMINGRRRDHGAERAHLELFEGGDMVKVNPLAYWEFQDCWNYLKKYNLAHHPLHDQGYPSVGDIHSTLPVPREQWFEYGGERSGRFQGLTNKDGSAKTECGIHVGDARQVASEISSSL